MSVPQYKGPPKKRRDAKITAPIAASRALAVMPVVSGGGRASAVVRVPLIVSAAVISGGSGRIISDGRVTVPVGIAAASSSPPMILLGSSVTVKPPPMNIALRGVLRTSSGSATVQVTTGAAMGTIYQSVTVKVGAGGAPPPPIGWFVSSTASPSGTGTLANPWQLQTALSNPGGVIHPGDTIWMRGGIYSGKNWNFSMSGTAVAPIILRNYPDGSGFGERVRLVGTPRTVDADCILNMSGSYIWVWGLEFCQEPPLTHTYLGQTQSCRNTWYTATSSPPDATLIDAIDDLPQGSGYTPRPGQKVINCRFHDVRQSISGTVEQVNQEIYGNLHWNVGYDEEPFPLSPTPVVGPPWAAEWSPTTAYVYGNTVSRASTYNPPRLNYVCIQANTGQAPPDNNYGNVNSYWIACFNSQRGHGFPTYFQNQTQYTGSPPGTSLPGMASRKVLKDNVGWGGFTGIFKFYGSGNTNETQSVDMIGNTTCMGGRSSTYGSQDDFLVGGGGANAHYVIDSNMCYIAPGYQSGPGQSFCTNNNGIGTCSDIVISNNFIGSNWGLAASGNCNNNVGLTLHDNTFMGGISFEAQWPTSTYHNTWVPGAAPTTNWTFVRPNQYEPGRATVVIYNYALQNTVDVNIAAAGLTNGQRYEVRDAFNPHGATNADGGDQIVMTGTFSSASPTVTFPMTGRLDPVLPYGYTTKPANETWHTIPITYPRYGIFLVLPIA